MKRHHLSSALGGAALALLAALGCEPELEPALFGEQRFDAGTSEDDAGDGGMVGAGGEDLTGTWAMVGDWSTCVTVFSTDELRTRYIQRVEIEQDGFRLRETHHICQAQNTPLLGLETVVSSAVTDAASPIVVESALIGSPGHRGYLGGAQAQLWGIDLEDPLTDPFPTAADLPDDRIYDSDGDGHPGATLKIGGDACEVYVAQRAVSAVHGDVQPDGTIVGTGYMFTEQTVIEATNAFCASPYQTLSNDAYSVVKLVRVDEDGLDLDSDGDGEVSCDEIVAEADRFVVWLEPDASRCEGEE